MEFKQPDKNREGRFKLNVPQRRSVHPSPSAPPAIKIGQNDTPPLFTKKNLIITGTVLLILVVIFIIFLTIRQAELKKDAQANRAPGTTMEDLEYQTVLPAGKPITELGGWKRVSPAGADPVYAYTDQIGETPINVSQQPLPASFLGDTDDQIADLAKKYNATAKIDLNGIKVYIGASAKGPQSVIFTKNSLLVLIKSDQKIDDAAWATYIKSLN